MITAIIQARLGSTRLPGKCLKIISNKPLLEHIINRIKESNKIKQIIIATTDLIEDDKIVDCAKKNDVKFYRGDVNNVLDRYYNAAKDNNANIIIRITADDPFKDPVIIDEIIEYFENNNYDYVSNTIKPTFPIGIDVEVFSFDSLKKVWLNAQDIDDLEHVTLFILKNINMFKIKNIENGNDLSHLRWTIDTKEDFLMAEQVYKYLYDKKKIFLMNDILILLKKHPEIIEINRSIKQRNFL